MASWFNVWKQAFDIGAGAPEVVSRRLTLMNPAAPWSLSTAVEAQQMVLEKMLATQESWMALCAGMMNPSMLPRLTAKGWTLNGTRATQAALRTADKAMRPVSKRVNANVRRLRKG